MEFRISPRVLQKLQDKHGVSMKEVRECFANRDGPWFRDSREGHVTEPPTKWFVAATDHQRILKIVFVEYAGFFAIKSAFEPVGRTKEHYQMLCTKHAR